jgi:riboflavin transporter FmnP
MYVQPSRKIAYAAIFGAFAGAISLIFANPLVSVLFGFPILTYLLIDPAEIFDFLAYFIGGPRVGILTAFIHFMILLLAAGISGSIVNLTGAPMKLAGVLSAFLGISIGLRLYSKAAAKSPRLNRMISTSFLSGAIVRVLIMIPANVVYFFVAGPIAFGGLDKLLGYAAFLLSKVGIQTSGFWDLMGWVLLITSIYNVFMIALAALPSYVLLVYTLKINTLSGRLYSGKVWIATHFNSNGGLSATKTNA